MSRRYEIAFRVDRRTKAAIKSYCLKEGMTQTELGRRLFAPIVKAIEQGKKLKLPALPEEEQDRAA